MAPDSHVSQLDAYHLELGASQWLTIGINQLFLRCVPGHSLFPSIDFGVPQNEQPSMQWVCCIIHLINYHHMCRCVTWNNWIFQLHNQQGQWLTCTTSRRDAHTYLLTDSLRQTECHVGFHVFKRLKTTVSLIKLLPYSVFQPLCLVKQINGRETGFLASCQHSHIAR